MIWALVYKFKEWLIGLGAVLAVLGSIYLKGRKDGADSVEDKAEEYILKDVEDRKKIKNSVDAMSDDAVRRELREHWTRKK